VTVNRTLTRRRRYVDTQDYAAMVRRILRAYATRVAQADDPDLTEMVELRTILDDLIADAIAGLRSHGYTWTQIGAALNITKQAAQQRYGRRP